MFVATPSELNDGFQLNSGAYTDINLAKRGYDNDTRHSRQALDLILLRYIYRRVRPNASADSAR